MVADPCRPGNRLLACGVKGSMTPNWREYDRRVVSHAKNVGAHVDVADINEAPRPELEFQKVFSVGAQSDFVVDSRRHVAEVRRRYVLAHDRLEIKNVDRVPRVGNEVL